jgi:hypothetical protein
MALATLVYNLKRATNALGRRRMIALLASSMKR